MTSEQNEQGAIAIIVALCAAVLLVISAFVVDFGLAYSQKRAISTGADAAALAAARQIEEDTTATDTCAEIAARYSVGSGDYNSLRSDVVSPYLSDNDPLGSEEGPIGAAVLRPGTDGLRIECVSGLGAVVTVEPTKSVDTGFGAVAGVDQINVAQIARSVLGPARTITGLRPYAVCQGIANTIIAQPDVSHTIQFDNSSSGCGSAPGNWGVIDFNGGSNPTPEIEDWTEFGYHEPITISPDGTVTFNGNPGAPNPGALEAEMNTLLDKEIAIPIYDLVTGSGQNSEFRVTGFMGLKVCAWKFNNKEGGQSPPTSCYDAAAVPVPVPSDYIQVRFTSYIPVAELDTGCELGDVSASCSPGLRVVKLAD